MYIREIHIENIRGFAEVDLNLARPDRSYAGWTVIAGRNGSGKSTLLRAMALSIMREAWSLQDAWGAEWVRSGQREGKARAVIVPSANDESPPPRTRASAEPFATWVVFKADSSGAQVGGGSDGTISFGMRGWFLSGYGPFRRLSGHAPTAESKMRSTARSAGLVSLFRADASLIEGVEWLKNINHQALEEEAGIEGRAGARELEKGVRQLLNDDLLPGGWQIEKIDSAGVWTRRNGLTLPLNDLSDGYQSVVALVLDIIKQIHVAYGAPVVEHSGDHARVLHAGVVLIDEPEAHLHVHWQKRIGFWLKEHFPGIQFIVTTHSPFICQAADPNGLFRLAAPSDPRPTGPIPEDVYHTVINGSADDAVMTELFGEERPTSDAAEKLREDVSELESRVIQGKATRGDKVRLKELKAQLPRTLSAEVEKALSRLSAQIDAKTGEKR